MGSLPGPGDAHLNINGEDLFLRPIRADDVDRLRALHRRLSANSQRMRFFSAMRELPQAMAERLCNVDFVDRAAFVFVDQDDTLIRGVGRYEGEGNGSAEIAVTVQDAYQGQGLGMVLVKKLSEHAKSVGLKRLSAQVLGENTRMLELLRHSGLPMHVEYHSGVATVTLDSE